MRDGDPDLYRMNADGGGVQRLRAATTGYDGGATFDADCSHIAWHASRPKGKDVAAYQRQLAAGAVQPETTELWVASADGTDARQVTVLDVRSSGAAWVPGERRLLFTSSYGSKPPPSVPAGALDTDLWAIDLDGTSLERVTSAPGPDLSPAFSADGKQLAFASLRGSRTDGDELQEFVARWNGAWRHVEERPADHLMGDAAWLSDRAREGRAIGTQGLDGARGRLHRADRSGRPACCPRARTGTGSRST